MEELFGVGLVLFIIYELFVTYTAQVIAGAVAIGIIWFLIWSNKKQKKEEQLNKKIAEIRKCPKCGGAGKVEKVEDAYDSYETTNVETRRTTHFNKDGDETGYSEYEVEVPVTKTRKFGIAHLHCSSCSHKWTKSFS